MKYLVNRQSKEHYPYYGGDVDLVYWRVVEADEEGWIKWHGDTESPLPDDCKCEVKECPGDIRLARHTAWDWIEGYRPILDKPDKEFLEACNNSSGAKFAEGWNADIDSVFERAIEEAAATEGRLPTLLERLKAAHEAAQRIPDLEAELREVLGAMGYDLVARSPFVERTDSDNDVVEPEGGTETAQDMSDWRNWKPGDLVTWKPGAITYPWWTPGKLYEVTLRNGELVVIADDGGFYNISDKRLSNGSRFRFYSRQKVKS